MDDPRCPLCERHVPELTEHHLIPKSEARRKGKKIHELPTVMLCRACHRQIHALYSNRDLAARLADLESLRQEETVRRYLSWVRRQHGSTGIRIRR